MIDFNSYQDLTRTYIDHFDIVRADTPSLLDEVHRLRYQVYCLENDGFENADEHPDGRERDSDDDRSIHALLLHRRTGNFAGTVRVILPTLNGSPWRPLPMHRILEAQGGGLLSQLPPVHDLAEVSRFAVSKAFRRRQGEERYVDMRAGDASSMSDEQRTMPYITFGLLRGMLEICYEQQMSHVCAVMEPALIRILRRFGLKFEPIGEPIEHHGTRWCCVAPLADLVKQGTALSDYTRESLGQGGQRDLQPRAEIDQLTTQLDVLKRRYLKSVFDNETTQVRRIRAEIRAAEAHCAKIRARSQADFGELA
jgi:N-acyl amino acid synthase of PEP-CTERM/exosortase system